MIESEAGKIKVYTLSNFPFGADNRQVVRLRMSRPKYEAGIILENGDCEVRFRDQDNPGMAMIMFPAGVAERMGLLQQHSMPGLTFYVEIDPGQLRAVGTQWRADTKQYVW